MLVIWEMGCELNSLLERIHFLGLLWKVNEIDNTVYWAGFCCTKSYLKCALGQENNLML